MTVYNDSPANIATLAAALRFEPIVAHAWIHAEGQFPGNPTNPLNCAVPTAYQGHPLPHPNAPASATAIGVTPSGRFYVYRSATEGLQAAVHALHVLAPLYGYGAILAQAGSGNAYAQARTIERLLLGRRQLRIHGHTGRRGGPLCPGPPGATAPATGGSDDALATDKPLAVGTFTPGATLYAHPDGTGADVPSWPGGAEIPCGAYSHPRAVGAALMPVWPATPAGLWFVGVDHLVPGTLAIAGAVAPPPPPPPAPHTVVLSVDGKAAATITVP